MSKMPEVFAIFEQKLAHVLSFTVVPLKSKDLKNALEEILTYFSGIVKRASKAESRIAELEAYIDQLIEIGGWAITGMTIATSYSPGEMQNLAEKKSDDWYALIKNLKECDKEKEREE